MPKTTTTIDQAASLSLPREAVDALGVEAGAELEVEIISGMKACWNLLSPRLKIAIAMKLPMLCVVPRPILNWKENYLAGGLNLASSIGMFCLISVIFRPQLRPGNDQRIRKGCLTPSTSWKSS